MMPERLDPEWRQSWPGAPSEKMEGFQGRLTLVDRQSGELFTITLWESEAARRKSEAIASNQRQRVAQKSGIARTSVKNYEVLAASGVAQPIGAGTSG